MYTISISQSSMVVSFVTSDLTLAMQALESLDSMRPSLNTWIKIEDNTTGDTVELKYCPVHPLP